MIHVFDLYGTLLDVGAVGGDRPDFTADWRRKQLEYSWLRTVAGDRADFARVTRDALDWAAERHGVPEAEAEALMAAYARPPAFPDAVPALTGLRARGPVAVFSNGSPDMLATACADLPLDAVLSVEPAGRFKPAREAYAIVTAHFGCAPDAVTFVSANGWDVYGAGRAGFRTIWVNRAGLPADRLSPLPYRIVTDLGDLT